MTSTDIKKLEEKKQELAVVIGKIYAGKEKNVKKAKNLRIEIARLLTPRPRRAK